MINKLKPNEANLIPKIRSINKKRSFSSDDRQIIKKKMEKKTEKTEFEVDLDKMTYEEILAFQIFQLQMLPVLIGAYPHLASQRDLSLKIRMEL